MMSSSPSPPPDLVLAPSLAHRFVAGFGASILGGAALGVAAWWADQLEYPFGLLIPANMIGSWLALAFILGVSARTVPTGALRGLIGLVAAVAAYYLLLALLGHGIRAIGASHAASIWGAVALIAGPVMGGAGAIWRHGSGWPRIVGVAVLSAGLFAEGFAFGAPRLVHPEDLVHDPGAFVFGAEMILGIALPYLMLPRGERIRGYLAASAVAIVAALAITPVTTILRDLADRF